MEGESTDNDEPLAQDDDDFDPNEFMDDSQDSQDSEDDANNFEKPAQNEEEDVDEEEENVSTGGHKINKKLICIRYPGNVVNADKALETLGGISQISTAVTMQNRRLELRFRPADGYCKPACGDRHGVCGFLMRVRIKKSRVNQVTKANQEKLIREFRDHESAMPKDPTITKNASEDFNEQIKSVIKDLRKSSIDPNAPTSSPYAKIDDIPSFNKTKCEDLSKDEDYRLPRAKILGKVETEFRFTSLCDFQYLPVHRKIGNSSVNECIYEKIFPVGVPSPKWLETEVPYFFPPAVFSRMDSIHPFSLKTETGASSEETTIGKTRKRRAGLSNFIHFNSERIPSTPPKGLETARQVKFVNKDHLQTMEKLFEERPIWSKNALAYKTNFTNEQMKILLPSCAYYFITGPWRIMWIKLGYDPRTDPSARKYQTLDYRLKSMHGLELKVKGKRSQSNYTLPYKSSPMIKSKTAVLKTMEVEEEVTKESTKSDDIYIYREGRIPPSRQMFYQYCDIESDEIQAMFDKLPDILPGTKCHEKRGWLPNGFSDHCREIINRQVKALLRKNMNIPEDHPTTLPRKRRRINMNLKLPGGRRAKRRKVSEKTSAKHKKPSTNELNSSDPDWEDT